MDSVKGRVGTTQEVRDNAPMPPAPPTHTQLQEEHAKSQRTHRDNLDLHKKLKVSSSEGALGAGCPKCGCRYKRTLV